MLLRRLLNIRFTASDINLEKWLNFAGHLTRWQTEADTGQG